MNSFVTKSLCSLTLIALLSTGMTAQAQFREQSGTGISPYEPWLGLVGDSGISGAVTSAQIRSKLTSILSLGLRIGGTSLTGSTHAERADIRRIPNPDRFGLTGKKIYPLTRIGYSQAELIQAEKDNDDIKNGYLVSLNVDIPEYSFGYLAGRALGFTASRIVLTAQDGQRVDSIYKQMLRFGEIAPTLPSHILISYSANDLCKDELDGSLEAFGANFRSIIERELKLTVENLKPHPRLGTKVVVMAPLDVPQILTNKALFAQKIYFAGAARELFGQKFMLPGFGGGQVTCGDLRYNTAAQSWIGEQMQKGLTGMCPAVISTSPDDTARIQKLTDFQNEQVRIWKDVLAQMHKPGWSFELSEASRRPVYETGDLANECFHPGPGAHAKIADELLKSLPADFKSGSIAP